MKFKFKGKEVEIKYKSSRIKYYYIFCVLMFQQCLAYKHKGCMIQCLAEWKLGTGHCTVQSKNCVRPWPCG